MELTVIVGFISTICGILCGVYGAKRNFKKDSQEDGKETGRLFSDIGYIKSGIDDLKRKQEKADERYVSVMTKLTEVEKSAKSAHRRIDEIREEMKL